MAENILTDCKKGFNRKHTRTNITFSFIGRFYDSVQNVDYETDVRRELKPYFCIQSNFPAVEFKVLACFTKSFSLFQKTEGRTNNEKGI